jgi:hypothetical protein
MTNRRQFLISALFTQTCHTPDFLQYADLAPVIALDFLNVAGYLAPFTTVLQTKDA